MAYRTELTEDELDDAAIADAVGSFILVKSRDWRRRQKNTLLPYVMSQVDIARALGDKPDVAKILENALVRGIIPVMELK